MNLIDITIEYQKILANVIEQSKNNYINDLSRFFRHYAITKKYPLTSIITILSRNPQSHLTEKPGKMISCRHSLTFYIKS